jgi:protease IV
MSGALRSARPLPLLLALLGAVVTAVLPRLSQAQQLTRLPDFGVPVASQDDGAALVQNPANLGFLSGPELRWTGVYLDDQHSASYEGHAFSLATWVPFLKVATGLRLDLLAPPGGSFVPDYQWLSWGLGFRLAQNSALGASLQSTFSNSTLIDDLTSFSVGYSTRPFNALGFAIVAHDINNPAPIAPFSFGRSFDFAMALRPLGTRSIELGVEGKYVEADDHWVPRATLGVDIPYVGRASGEVSVTEPFEDAERTWLAAAGLSVHVNRMDRSAEFGGGLVTGDSLGPGDGISGYSTVAFRSYRAPSGIEPKRYGVRLRIEATPDTRTHVAFLRQLWSLAEEPNVDAVVFEVRSSPGGSLAALEELRDAVYQLRRKGKRTLCHLEDADGGGLFFCSATNRVLINPSGGVRFAGMRSRHIYLARLLESLGIRAEIVRAGDHKSAPEQFTETGSSDVSRADKIDLLQQFERGFSEGLAVGRGLTVEQVRESLGQGPFVATEAKQHRFVDGFAFDDEIDKAVRTLTGRNTPLVNDGRQRVAANTFGNEGYVAVIYVDGDIVDGRNSSIPFFGMGVTGSYTIAETLKAVRENPRIGAVVVRVDSPGGSSMASDVIWRQVELTAKAKPTVVSMGSVAASGGYYLAAPATRIFASPLTVTGSIGVFAGKADVSQLLNRIGVDVEVYKTHDRADADSFFRPLKDSERAELERKVQQFYQVFLERVASGRKMKKEDVDKVAQGRVWTGEQAKAHGLIDELGGLRQALAFARNKAGLPEDAPIVELPRVETSLLARLLGLPSLHQSLLDAPMPDGMTKALRALAPFAIYPADLPLARMEFVIEDVP